MALFSRLKRLCPSLGFLMSRNRKRRRAAYNIYVLNDDEEEKTGCLVEETVRNTNYVSVASGISTETTFLDIPGPTGAELASLDSLPDLLDDDDISSVAGGSSVSSFHHFAETDEEDADVSRWHRTASVRCSSTQTSLPLMRATPIGQTPS